MLTNTRLCCISGHTPTSRERKAVEHQAIPNELAMPNELTLSKQEMLQHLLASPCLLQFMH